MAVRRGPLMGEAAPIGETRTGYEGEHQHEHSSLKGELA
jgi:hypothetical protein